VRELFDAWGKGLLTDAELVSRLSELPWEELEALEDNDLRKRVLELKTKAEQGHP